MPPGYKEFAAVIREVHRAAERHRRPYIEESAPRQLNSELEQVSAMTFRLRKTQPDECVYTFMPMSPSFFVSVLTRELGKNGNSDSPKQENYHFKFKVQPDRLVIEQDSNVLLILKDTGEFIYLEEGAEEILDLDSLYLELTQFTTTLLTVNGKKSPSP